MINVEAPNTKILYPCEITVEKKQEYIDIIKSVINHCRKYGTNPAYVEFSSIKIGYTEYSFAFAKTLDFYKASYNQLPHIMIFSSKEIFEQEGLIPGVTYLPGINERNNKNTAVEYRKTGGTCEYDTNIKSKAISLTATHSYMIDKAIAIFYFVRDKIEYENYENSVYNAIGTLERKKGNSCDQANLLVSLCRVVGIPARYSYKEGIKFRNGFRKHVWAQILISDFWYVADPIDKQNYLGHIRNWDINNFYNLRQYTFLDF